MAAGEDTAKDRLHTLWEAGDSRTNAELAQEIGCSVSTVQSYRQEWRRERGMGPFDVSREVLSLIEVLRSVDRWKFSAIAQAVEEDFGLSLSPKRVSELYQRGMGNPPPIVVEVHQDDLPLKTLSGTCWCVPVQTITCERCPHLAQCQATNWRDYVACERPLEWELVYPDNRRKNEEVKNDRDVSGIDG